MKERQRVASLAARWIEYNERLAKATEICDWHEADYMRTNMWVVLKDLVRSLGILKKHGLDYELKEVYDRT